MLLDRVANEEGGDIPTHLVRPAEKRVVSKGGYHDLMLLPRFKCRGFFESGTFKLWIVWFQDTDAPPMSPACERRRNSLALRRRNSPPNSWEQRSTPTFLPSVESGR